MKKRASLACESKPWGALSFSVRGALGQTDELPFSKRGGSEKTRVCLKKGIAAVYIKRHNKKFLNLLFVIRKKPSICAAIAIDRIKFPIGKVFYAFYDFC